MDDKKEASEEMCGRIVLYTASGCPHCREAKSTLEEYGAKFLEINITAFPERRVEMAQRTNKKTVPQIFFNDRHIGGNAELQALVTNATLPQLIQEAQMATAPNSMPLPTETSQDMEWKGEETESDDSLAEHQRTAYLQQLAHRMVQSNKGIDIKTHWEFLWRHKKCFVGSEAVQWLIDHESMSSQQALSICTDMLDCEIMCGVSHTNRFFNGSWLYRFQIHATQGVLNMKFAYQRKTRAAHIVGENLRLLILKIYDEFLSHNGKHVDYAAIPESEVFMKYIDYTAELHLVNVEEMNPEEKMAFFINVYNALVVHGYIVEGPPNSNYARFQFFNKIKYNIGGLVYSLNDIEHGILRGNRPAPYTFRPPFSSRDPRRKHSMIRLDPRIHFALVCGAKSCPAIKIYSSSNLDEALTLATEGFFEDESNILVDVDKKEITLSKILDWYSNDFGDNQMELLQWVSPFLSEKVKTDFDLVVSHGVHISYFPYDWESNGV